MSLTVGVAFSLGITIGMEQVDPTKKERGGYPHGMAAVCKHKGTPFVSQNRFQGSRKPLPGQARSFSLNIQVLVLPLFPSSLLLDNKQ